AACVIRVESRAELADRCRFETRYYISSARLTAKQAAEAVRGHWGIESRPHWVLDVVFRDGQSRLRKGHGAKNMSVVRHFAINLVRSAKDKRSIKLRLGFGALGRQPRGLCQARTMLKFCYIGSGSPEEIGRIRGEMEMHEKRVSLSKPPKQLPLLAV